jgi:hypothetical protein
VQVSYRRYWAEAVLLALADEKVRARLSDRPIGQVLPRRTWA